MADDTSSVPSTPLRHCHSSDSMQNLDCINHAHTMITPLLSTLITIPYGYSSNATSITTSTCPPSTLLVSIGPTMFPTAFSQAGPLILPSLPSLFFPSFGEALSPTSPTPDLLSLLLLRPLSSPSSSFVRGGGNFSVTTLQSEVAFMTL